MPNSETIIYANARFVPVHYTNAVWNTSDPVLLDGEYGFVDDAEDGNHWIKRGDGIKHWSELDFIDLKFANSITMNGETKSQVNGNIDLGTVITDVSGKQDKTDNNLDTTSKTVVGAINELNSGKGTYSKPGDGIPKSDLASGVKASLDKADTALQQHQDISGKADTSFVNTELAKKQNKFADIESGGETTKLLSPVSQIGINCIEGIYFYNGIPTIGNMPTNEFDAVNKYYVDNFHDSTKLDTSKVKSSQSTTSGDVYDVTYINTMIGNIETLLQALRGNQV